MPSGSSPEEISLLDEIRKEVLKNAIYYVDTKTHEITRRVEAGQLEMSAKSNALKTAQKELEGLEARIKELSLEVDHLRKSATVDVFEGTVDMRALLEKVSESSNELHSQSTMASPLSSEPPGILYKVSFINTEIPHVQGDIIDVLEKVRRTIEKKMT
ncbi:uncharacterized protein NEMAJ01_1422 [Nematocida major]|uniref:uncharacterized protein n=1 Tax=Nematocida major TaxID=1912982 RepID=UPI0020072D1E|nr:uncharacterized protein NEMAJ01_1422 [Nematocida major]KAH9386526.1 hypothetical protein NEMAJ01_1422 [Nematocida major]